MATAHGTLLVVGSGPGVGRGVAAHFAKRGFQQVVLFSRNAERLSEDAEVVRSANAKTNIIKLSVDVADTSQLQESLEKIEASLATLPLECVLFNAARTARSKFFDFSPSELSNDLQIAIVGMYAVAKWAMPRLLEAASREGKTSAFLVTSGMLAKDPFPAMFALGAAKAGQYSLVQSLHKQFEPQGVHCSVVIIAGTVADDSEVTNASNIASEVFRAFSQPQRNGRLEIMSEDPAYAEHVKNRQK